MSSVIETFPCLQDNYGFLLHDNATGATAAIDAPDADAVSGALARTGWKLTDILVTHHHWDHTDGIASLKQAFNPRVTGPAAEAQQIAGLDRLVKGGDHVAIGNIDLEVIETPGHTLGHVVYFDPANKNLFCGDALFSLGCGRMLEGTPGPMWDGLERIRGLPDQTMVFCGHEYSAANAKFALSIDPDNSALKKRAAQIADLRKAGRPTIPFLLGEDKAANPFLRADISSLAQSVGSPGQPAGAVFAAVRKAKDHFKA